MSKQHTNDYGGFDNENNYAKSTFDIDPNDQFDTEIKINPSFYIHINLLKAQEALVKDDAQSGFLQYRVCAEHLERLAKSAGLVPSDYESKVKKFKDDNKLEDHKIPDSVKVANYKYELLLTEVFGTRALNSGLTIDPKKVD